MTLVERNRIRGWIAIIREGKGFIEQTNSMNISNQLYLQLVHLRVIIHK